MKRKKQARKGYVARENRNSAGPGSRSKSERGAVKKKWSGRVSVALIFPDTYALGMSNIGFQLVYQRLNQADNIVAERFFVPDAPASGKTAGKPQKGIWRSTESNRPLHDFDILLFSISFETGYINVVRALHDAGLAVFSRKRDHDSPLILAGGVACQINPEPIADIVDAFLLGDFEAMEEGFIPWLSALNTETSRKSLLQNLSDSCPGTYLPCFCSPIYDSSGAIKAWDSKNGITLPISTAIYLDTPKEAPHTTITTPDAVFSDMRLIELARGCGRGCRFCAAGFIYRPPRPWPRHSIDAALKPLAPGAKAGMVGLEFLEREDVMNICETLIQRGISLTFSSLRTDAITPRFVKLLRASGCRTATIAPEAGSEKLRRIINKNLTEQDILKAVEIISVHNIPNIKCYFMLGLPFEQDSDVEAIVELVDKIRQIALASGKKRGNLGTITVSVSTFVPKAWTPFQWVPFATRPEISRKQQFLKKSFASMPNVVFKHDSWNSAFPQAVLSRGGRELAEVLNKMAQYSYSFKKAVMSSGINTDKSLKGFELDEILPWEIIIHRVKKDYLQQEWKRAVAQRQTTFCNTEICRRCGACNPKTTCNDRTDQRQKR